MVKRISECDTNWNDLQTLALADQMCVDDFAPIASSCRTMDDFENGAKEIIFNKIDSCKQNAETLDPNNNLQLFVLAALDHVDINKLLQVVTNCFESELRVARLESRVNNIYNLILEKKNRRQINERSTTDANTVELAAFDIATKF